MRIIANGIETELKSGYEDHKHYGGYVRPALHIITEQALTAEQVDALTSGEITVIDDGGNEISHHEGFTLLTECAITLTKESETEREIARLRVELEAAKAENANLQIAQPEYLYSKTNIPNL